MAPDALDGTVLDLPDSDANARVFGRTQDKGPPGEPKIAFNPKRPIPAPPGDVRNIESLTTRPPGYTMQKRNNFYKKVNGKDLPGTGLYR